VSLAVVRDLREVRSPAGPDELALRTYFLFLPSWSWVRNVTDD